MTDGSRAGSLQADGVQTDVLQAGGSQTSGLHSDGLQAGDSQADYFRECSEQADRMAISLLGSLIVRDFDDGTRIVARIVETEAYDQTDPASHTYHGLSQRNRAMFGPARHAYIYVSHGIHHCMNVTAGPDGFGAGALVRAAQVVEGVPAAIRNRGGRDGKALANGPAKLCQALCIGMDLYGHDLDQPPLRVVDAPLRDGERIVCSPRIVISKAKERRRRYFIDADPCVSASPFNRDAQPIVIHDAGQTNAGRAGSTHAVSQERMMLSNDERGNGIQVNGTQINSEHGDGKVKDSKGLAIPVVSIKRAYAQPQESDGFRVLVDRLWPRGTSKAKAHIDAWVKDVAPSKELRTWFAHIPERFSEFAERYVAELDANPEGIERLRQAWAGSARVTLVFAAKDEAHNNAVVLRDYLVRQGFAREQ